MTEQVSFKLSEAAAAAYRRLHYDENAALTYCWIPLSTIFWADEHPGGTTLGLPDDEESMLSVVRLVGARSALWGTGEIPDELQGLWAEAKEVIPDWPGFRRLTLTSEQMELAIRVDEESEAMWNELSEAAREAEESTDSTGVSRVDATFDLRDEEGKKS